MVRSIEVQVPTDSGRDEAELAARVQRHYPRATVSVRRGVHVLGGTINGGICALTQADLQEHTGVARTILREAHQLEMADRPAPDGDDDVEGAIDEVRRSARWI